MNQIEDMQTFVRIVEAGSITKAADQLSTVKSAVSRRLTDLEKRLGVTLLTRTTRSQTLTDQGRSFYQQSLSIIDNIDELESSMRHSNCALSGKIKIAAPISFGLGHLNCALYEFNQLHPEIVFDIDLNDRKVDLVEGGFDLAIRIAHLNDSSLIARKLATTKLVLSASPSYLATNGLPLIPKDLSQNHKKLHYIDAPENWQFYDENGKPISIKIPSAMVANNGNFLMQGAIDGLGIIHSPDFICYKAIASGKLQLLLTDFLATPEVPIYAIYPQNRHLSHRVRVLIEFLKQRFDQQAHWGI